MNSIEKYEEIVHEYGSWEKYIDLTMMSKIELGDDVIAEIRRLKELIHTASI